MSSSLDMKQLLVDDLQVLGTPLAGAARAQRRTKCLHWETLNKRHALATIVLTTCVESWRAERRGPAGTAATGPPAARPRCPSRW